MMRRGTEVEMGMRWLVGDMLESAHGEPDV